MPPRAIYEHSGPAELVLEGKNLTPDTLKLYHNGVLYTPLESSDTYARYLLGDNGTNKVMLNGKNYCTIVVRDVIVPDGFPTEIIAALKNNPTTGFNPDNMSNKVTEPNANCINYPFKTNGEYPYCIMRFKTELANDENLLLQNCTLEASGFSETSSSIVMSPIDPSHPCWVKWKGFIIAVFNYSA